MTGRVAVIALICVAVFGLNYRRLSNFLIGDVTITDHPIVKALNSIGAIESTDENFRGVTEVCIVNNTDISKSEGRNCKTSGEVLALIRDTSCDILPLEKLRARVLLSENTFECRKTSNSFRMVFHKQIDSTEILDFE